VSTLEWVAVIGGICFAVGTVTGFLFVMAISPRGGR
jgi:hypothetical protein